MKPLARNTIRLSDTARGARAGAGLLRSGGLVAFPTETVYGLGADAANEQAVAALYAAKGRPSFNPLIAHVADLEAAARLAAFDATAERLAEAFWPGPLTLVLPRRPGAGLAERTCAGLSTAAVRVPAAPAARRLIEAFGGPVAAPSANRSGGVSPTTADHVLEDLYGLIDAVIDGGPARVGVESTIVAVQGGVATLLREGGAPAEAIEAVAGRLARAGEDAPDAPQSPGRLLSHYAPRARLRLNAEGPRPGEAWLGFGPEPAGIAAHDGPRRNLSMRGDTAEAAARLFADLRALDAALGGEGVIAVAPTPERGLGAAISDRLRRGAAERQ